MSNLQEAIRQRRSIRKFQPKHVPTELVVEVLEAAGWAPSAHNSQPWRFIVLQDANVKRELAEKMATAWAADMLKDGSTVDEAKRVERSRTLCNCTSAYSRMLNNGWPNEIPRRTAATD